MSGAATYWSDQGLISGGKGAKNLTYTTDSAAAVAFETSELRNQVSTPHAEYVCCSQESNEGDYITSFDRVAFMN